MVVAEARLRYLAGARFDDELDIELPIAKLGTTSMIVTPVFRVDGRDMVEGEVRHVFVEPGRQQPSARSRTTSGGRSSRTLAS